MSKSVIWLRISYLGAPPPTSVDLNLRFNIKDVTGHPTAELFVGNTRVSPPGRIQIAPGTLAFTLLHINSVAAADGKGQYLDIILRVCGTTTDVEGTFNFNEVSGDLIL